MAEKDLLKWILSYERLAAQRLAAHELNNYMTPLAMQLSMLKTHLANGDIEKAGERIAKLENALAKLEEYSKSQFVKVSTQDLTMLSIEPESLGGFVRQLLDLLKRDGIQVSITDVHALPGAEVSEYHLTIFLYKIVNVLDEMLGIDQLVFTTPETEDGNTLNLQVITQTTPDVLPPIHPEIQRCAKLVNGSTSVSHLSVTAHSSTSYSLTIT